MSLTLNRFNQLETRSFKRSAVYLASLAVIGFGLTSCGGGGGDDVAQNRVQVEIKRTSYGVPHIKADNIRSAAYGMAYAYAQDNICTGADRLMTVAGERSKYLGSEGISAFGSTVNNLNSDFYFRAILDEATVNQAFANISSTAKESITGYVEGYNRFLKDAKATDLAQCASTEWVKRPATELDLKRHLLSLTTRFGGEAMMQAIADAPLAKPASAAPTALTLSALTQSTKSLDRQPIFKQMQVFAQQHQQYKNEQLARLNTKNLQKTKASVLDIMKALDDNPVGSNAQVFGSETSENGRGLLIGNPHFPWSGSLRFYQSHVSIGKEFDVIGANLGLVPLPLIGYNKDMAWTHTVSTGRRYTLAELTLNGENYIVDGVAKPLTKKQVSVEVLNKDGKLETQTRVFYFADKRPLVVNAASEITWTATKAFALRDANLDNGRFIDQLWDTGRAANVEGLRDVQAKHLALPWVNTLATDRSGKAYYADMTTLPNVTKELIARCATSDVAKKLIAGRVYVLDGSKTSCDWINEAGAVSPGLVLAKNMPQVVRSDYVGNSNESAWLTHPAQPLTGFPPLIGFEARAQSLRTRMAFTQIEDRLAGRDGLAGKKVSPEALEQIFFENRVYSAELVLPALLELCKTNSSAQATNGNTVDLQVACTLLQNWDKRAKISSVGTHVFREFWRKAQAIPNLYSVPFNSADPVHTPNTPNIQDPTIQKALLTALADGILALNTAKVPLNAALGDIQYLDINGKKIPFPGGDEFEGIYNKMTPTGLIEGGYTKMAQGSSYIQIVSYDANGTISAKGLLAYGQSTNSKSPHLSDQTEIFGSSKLVKIPFTDAEIAADVKSTLNLQAQ